MKSILMSVFLSFAFITSAFADKALRKEYSALVVKWKATKKYEDRQLIEKQMESVKAAIIAEKKSRK